MGVAAACAALGVPRSSFYHAQKPSLSPSVSRPRPRSSRALSVVEQCHVRELLCSERFVNLAPRTVYAILLDEGRYLCSWRTMYRLLAQDQACVERRALRQHPAYSRPELLATGPREVWSWDITKLRGPTPGVWYQLYLVLDIFSRKIVGWLIAETEDSGLAEALIAESCAREGIKREQLTLHADRGAAMTSKTVAELLSELGVAQSHSRPRISNDNPYSEAQFKTLKYTPSYPERFSSIEAARDWMCGFASWYNNEHRHSGIGLLPPAVVHSGQARIVSEKRQQLLNQAYEKHPERFVRGRPQAPRLPQAVGINLPSTSVASPTAATAPLLPTQATASKVSAAKRPFDAAATVGYPEAEVQTVRGTNAP